MLFNSEKIKTNLQGGVPPTDSLNCSWHAK
uniref:Uncharacterized protein n=1 Tax=Rhizophora mucronata TaxID=61149 RepID=A0A2P2MN27_RHIMU